MSELKLEVGKWYETRDGESAWIAFNDPARQDSCFGCLFHGDGSLETVCWHDHGAYCNHVHGSDLIREIPPPSERHPGLPEWAYYIAEECEAPKAKDEIDWDKPLEYRISKDTWTGEEHWIDVVEVFHMKNGEKCLVLDDELNSFRRYPHPRGERSVRNKPEKRWVNIYRSTAHPNNAFCGASLFDCPSKAGAAAEVADNFLKTVEVEL